MNIYKLVAKHVSSNHITIKRKKNCNNLEHVVRSIDYYSLYLHLNNYSYSF